MPRIGAVSSRLATEQQIFHERLAGAFDAAFGAVPDSIGRLLQLAIERLLIVHRLPREEIGPRDVVVGIGLMLQHHQRDDVAMRRQILRRVEAAVEARLIQPRRVIDLVAIEPPANDQIAEVLLIAVRAGDVPAAPALFERRGLIDAIRARGEDRQPAASENTERTTWPGTSFVCDEPWQIRQLSVCRRKFGASDAVLIERVKDRAELRIDGRNFQHVALLAEADINIVVEIQRPRRVRARCGVRCRLVLEKTSICDSGGHIESRSAATANSQNARSCASFVSPRFSRSISCETRLSGFDWL